MSSLQSTTHRFDPRPDYPLLITVKQYYDPSTRCVEPDALTLVFAHATTHMKEIWEPCIDELFALMKAKGLRVNDLWSIDAPNHGDTAAMNTKVLEWCYQHMFRYEDYSRAIHAVVTNSGTGIDVDFSKRRLVGVGHSMGGMGMMQSTTFRPYIAWEALFIVETMLVPRIPPTEKVRAALVAVAEKQVSTWASLDEARKAMLRSLWRAWDKRVFETFLKYGLRPVDSDNPGGPVTLKVSNADAAACYRDEYSAHHSYLYLANLVKRIPTHLIYGGVPDLFAVPARIDVINNASGGRDKLASVTLIEGAGHLVTATHPTQLAYALFDQLQHIAGSSPQRARL